MLEYVLLLVIGLTVAMMITTTMVSRNPNSPGFLVRKWVSIITAIGADPADSLAPTK